MSAREQPGRAGSTEVITGNESNCVILSDKGMHLISFLYTRLLVCFGCSPGSLFLPLIHRFHVCFFADVILCNYNSDFCFRGFGPDFERMSTGLNIFDGVCKSIKWSRKSAEGLTAFSHSNPNGNLALL